MGIVASRPSPAWLFRLFVPVLTTSAVVAQCTLTTEHANGSAGVLGRIRASVLWDSDGAGPRRPEVVLGGDVFLAGSLSVANIVAFEPVTRTLRSLGNGSPTSVLAMCTMPSGDLVISRGQVVSRWNGTTWQDLPGAASTRITAVLALPNGDIVVGGLFSSIGGIAANRLARFNGSTWSEFGGGCNGAIVDLELLPSGDVIAAGAFSTIGGVAANAIARWDGSQWTPLGAGPNGSIRDVKVLPNGDVIMGGSFSTVGALSANCIARWDGSAWSTFAGGIPGQLVEQLAPRANGNLIATGWLNARVAAWEWDGASWAARGTIGDQSFTVRELSTGEWLAGTEGVPSLLLWNGASWSGSFLPMVAIDALLTQRNGDVIAAGRFTTSTTHVGLASWDGSAWVPFGGTVDNVRSLAEANNGDIVVGGGFTTAGTVPANGVARWSNGVWSAVGAGSSGVSVVAALANGDILTGGSSVRRWDGTVWSDLGSVLAAVQGPPFTVPGRVFAIAQLSNGEVVIGGQFNSIGSVAANGIARWDGSSFSAFGSGVGFSYSHEGVAVTKILPHRDGFYAGGFFVNMSGLQANGIAQWSPSGWFALGTGFNQVTPNLILDAVDLAPLPNGDLMAAGLFSTAGGVATGPVARWSGVAWSAVATGFTTPMSDLTVGRGAVHVAYVTSTVASYTRLTTTCPAAVVSVGQTCAGSTGLGALRASGQPWVGAEFVSSVTGMTGVAALEVLGFASAQVPLPFSPGCLLLESPDVIFPRVPVGDEVVNQVVIPNSPSLATVQVWQQVVRVAVGQLGQVDLTATQALRLTLGAM